MGQLFTMRWHSWYLPGRPVHQQRVKMIKTEIMVGDQSEFIDRVCILPVRTAN